MAIVLVAAGAIELGKDEKCTFQTLMHTVGLAARASLSFVRAVLNDLLFDPVHDAAKVRRWVVVGSNYIRGQNEEWYVETNCGSLKEASNALHKG